jgi:hypothetical protein
MDVNVDRAGQDIRIAGSLCALHAYGGRHRREDANGKKSSRPAHVQSQIDAHC